LGQLRSQLRPSWNQLGTSWGQLGPCRSQLGPSWNQLGQSGCQLGPSGTHLASSGATLSHLGTSWGALGRPVGGRCSESPRLRTRMKGQLGCLSASRRACESQMCKITAPAHKNKQAPWAPGSILGGSLEQKVQNHRACAQK